MDIASVFPEYIIKELAETSSTNLYMEEVIKRTDLAEGSVVYTEVQTDGIGHANNKWESEPHKNLTATLLLKPGFLKAYDQFFLTIITSLAVVDTIEYFIKDVKPEIKWPNDVFCNHRKTAGILIKNHIMGSTISKTIIGVGLNINQTTFNSAPNATSFKKLSGKDFWVKEVMSKWHENMAAYYLKLRNDRNSLTDHYLSKLYLKDKTADYLINDEKIRATIKGIDVHGQLVLHDERNKEYICGLKEIVFPVFR